MGRRHWRHSLVEVRGALADDVLAEIDCLPLARLVAPTQPSDALLDLFARTRYVLRLLQATQDEA
jgi:hypothetical protein